MYKHRSILLSIAEMTSYDSNAHMRAQQVHERCVCMASYAHGQLAIRLQWAGTYEPRVAHNSYACVKRPVTTLVIPKYPGRT